MGWSFFEKRAAKSKLNNRVRLDLMEESRLAKRMFRWGEGKTALWRDNKKVVRKWEINQAIRILTDD